MAKAQQTKSRDCVGTREAQQELKSGIHVAAAVVYQEAAEKVSSEACEADGQHLKQLELRLTTPRLPVPCFW